MTMNDRSTGFKYELAEWIERACEQEGFNVVRSPNQIDGYDFACTNGITVRVEIRQSGIEVRLLVLNDRMVLLGESRFLGLMARPDLIAPVAAAGFEV